MGFEFVRRNHHSLIMAKIEKMSSAAFRLIKDYALTISSYIVTCRCCRKIFTEFHRTVFEIIELKLLKFPLTYNGQNCTRCCACFRFFQLISTSEPSRMFVELTIMKISRTFKIRFSFQDATPLICQYCKKNPRLVGPLRLLFNRKTQLQAIYLYYWNVKFRLPEGAMLRPRRTEGWFQHLSVILWGLTASPQWETSNDRKVLACGDIPLPIPRKRYHVQIPRHQLGHGGYPGDTRGLALRDAQHGEVCIPKRTDLKVFCWAHVLPCPALP